MYNEIVEIFALPTGGKIENNSDAGISPGVEMTERKIKKMLAAKINELIVSDFSHLVYLLYRFDINEKKLKAELSAQEANAGDVIADLVIERAKQKEVSRKQFKQNSDNISEEEKW